MKCSKIYLLFSILSIIPSAATADEISASEQIVSHPVSTLKWVEIPDTDGIKYANVRGDLAGEGPYEAFVLFPAGKDNPFHHHSASIPTVILQGTFYAVIDGKRSEYPAGSFYDLPGGLNHFSGCVSGMNCLLFQYQESGFDLIPQSEQK